MPVFIDNSTGEGQEVTRKTIGDETGAAYVEGASNDTFTIQCAHPRTPNIWIDVLTLTSADDGSWVGFSPVPAGTYRVKRDGNNDQVTLVIDI